MSGSIPARRITPCCAARTRKKPASRRICTSKARTNTADFDAAQHAVPVDELLEIDRYALAMTARMQDDIAGDYERFQFHLVAQKLQAFCSEDLGAFLLDILKDRLYTCKADSLPRRSAQTALHHVTHSLVRLMAPILSFTAEELWQVFTGKRDDSVFFQTWHALPRPKDGAQLLPKWERLRELRNPVRKKIEELRAAGQVGSSLQAEVDFHADGGDYELLRSLGEDLKFVMLTSAARVHRASGELRVEVAPSLQRKCERCWHYRPDVDDEALCGRCRSNLHGPGEKRLYA